jgi:hypothetical protein
MITAIFDERPQPKTASEALSRPVRCLHRQPAKIAGPKLAKHACASDKSCWDVVGLGA